MVLGEESGIALSLLAEYRKPEDIELISSFYHRKGYLDSFLQAVENFPDEKFYKYILEAVENEEKENKYYDNSNWDRILITLAKYPSLETKSIFEELLVNALVHRDYSIMSAVKLFIFAKAAVSVV